MAKGGRGRTEPREREGESSMRNVRARGGRGEEQKGNEREIKTENVSDVLVGGGREKEEYVEGR